MASSKKTLKEDRKSTALRHELFCREFIIDFNATRAATAAGFSKKTAKQQGSRLLTRVDVQKRIAELIQKRKAKVEFTAENVLKELGIIGLSNIQDYIKKGDERFVIFKNIDDLPREVAAAIESIEFTDKGVKFKLHGKVKALELSLRHFGLLIDTLKVKGDFTHTHDVSMKDLRDAINAVIGKGKKRNRKP